METWSYETKLIIEKKKKKGIKSLWNDSKRFKHESIYLQLIH